MQVFAPIYAIKKEDSAVGSPLSDRGWVGVIGSLRNSAPQHPI